MMIDINQINFLSNGEIRSVDIVTKSDSVMYNIYNSSLFNNQINFLSNGEIRSVNIITNLNSAVVYKVYPTSLLFYGGYVKYNASSIIAYNDENKEILNLNVTNSTLNLGYIHNFVIQKQSLLWTIDKLSNSTQMNQTWKINYHRLIDDRGVYLVFIYLLHICTL